MSTEPTPGPTHTPEQESEPRQKRSRREQSRMLALLVLSVVITLFAVLNLDEVKVDWIVGSGHAPLIIVIVISLLVGIVITRFAARRSGRRR